MIRLAVLIPCRDEAEVIERKLANLALCGWPRASAPHLAIVIDDGSSDATREISERACERLRRRGDVLARVIENRERPGKVGAIRSGLAAIAREADVIVLTDADVVLAPDALVEIARRFDEDPRIGMLSGAQRFVVDLAPDGACRNASGGELESAGGLYDRWTALARRCESRIGRLFSVHGQLLAWRASLELAPSDGIAADDIELRCEARTRGARIELAPRAVFYEVKAPAGEARRSQALRRARAYVQCMKSARIRELARSFGALDRAQLAFYRRVPTATPLAFALAIVLAAVAVALWTPRWTAIALAAAFVAFLASAAGRRLIALFAVIRRAERLERSSTLSDRWQTARR
jgi:glycosyltransferase involved in cell wall biosynthesis